MKQAKTFMIITLIFSLCLFLGCSKANEEIEYTTTNSEHITKEIVNTKENVIAKIDADIIYPEAKDIPVVTTKKYEFTNDDIKRIADAIYDNSEYSTTLCVGDIRYTKDTLYDLISEVELQISDLEALYNDNKIDLNYYSNEMYNCQYQIDSIKGLIDSAPVDKELSPTPEFTDITYQYVISDAIVDPNNPLTFQYEFIGYETATFQGCCLEGNYNNMTCNLIFRVEPAIQLDLYDINKFVWKTYLYKDIRIGEMGYECFTSNNPNIENECTYSVGDATELCNGLLKQIGISDMAPMDICNIPLNAYNTSSTGYQYGNPIDNGYCGYKIYYGKSINSVNYNITTLMTGGANPSLYKEADVYSIYGEEYIVFTVMDCGIISMEYYNPTTIEDITSTNATILDFDSILSFADIYLSDAYGDRADTAPPLNISRVQLGLARTANNLDTDAYTLIPVWDFYYDNTLNPILTINAIDGSKIDRFTGLTIE